MSIRVWHARPAALSCRQPSALIVSPIAPPYACFAPPSDVDRLRPHELSPGTIFGLEIRQRPCSVESLRQGLHRIRRRFPAVPIVLHLSQPLDPETVHLTQLATQLHVRGAIVDPEPVCQTLRRLLTDPVDLAYTSAYLLTDTGGYLFLPDASRPAPLSFPGAGRAKCG